MQGIGFRGARAAVLASLALALLALPAAAKNPYKGYEKIDLKDGPTLLDDLKMALLTAQPGTIIQLPKTELQVDEELSISTSHIVLRGKNPKKTVLRFDGQTSGGQSILVTGDHVAVENLAVVNPQGDGIKSNGVVGITFRRVRVEWEGPLSSDNGPYGLYPVLSEDVLIEKCEVRGASDAGIYVGQSSNIIVRKNKAHGNVAGIEIENSFDADVYQNKAYENTGGILVFNLPGLIQYGARTRVFKNKIYDNNAPNVGSGTVGQVPPGTGMIVLANDEVEVFQNQLKDNDTVGVTVVTYNVVGGSSPPFDPFSETIFLYKNKYKDNGGSPAGALGLVINAVLTGGRDIILETEEDPDKLVGGSLPDDLRICLQEKKFTFAAANWAGIVNGGEDPASTEDPSAHVCEHPELGEVVIPDPPAPPAPEVAAACAGGRDQAFLADCPRLSDYGLFEGGNPRAPVAAGVPFDLTTPLFSDYARKYRVAYLPDGEAAAYDSSGAFDFPVGTILAKTFAIADDLRTPEAGDEVVETRLLIHRPGGWVGRPYIWRENKSDADLALVGGAREISWVHTDGEVRTTTYSIPNANQCVRCHVDGGPIGPKARLLNDDYPYEGGAENQLTHWTLAGVLSGAPADPADAPRVPAFDDDLDGTLEERARGYLDVNCAHCHTLAGAAGSTGLWLDWGAPLDSAFGLCKMPVAAGQTATGGLTYDLVPGLPEDSILVYRMDSTNPLAAMPELGRSIVHDEGVALVAAWIETLGGVCP